MTPDQEMRLVCAFALGAIIVLSLAAVGCLTLLRWLLEVLS